MPADFHDMEMFHDRFHQTVHFRCGPAHKLDREGGSLNIQYESLNTSVMEQKNAILARLRPMLTNAKLPLIMFLIRMVVTAMNVLAQYKKSGGLNFELKRF